MTPILCSDNEFVDSKAWAFSSHHLSELTVPSSLRFQTIAAIFSLGQWFTECHVEVCGDDSISATLMGKKTFFYATRGNPSRILVRQVKSNQAVRQLVENGPPTKWADKWLISMPENSSLVIQPALCAHTVTTVRASALVAGWEGSCVNDTRRYAQVKSLFGFGIGMEYQEKFRELSPTKQEKIVERLSGDFGVFLRRSLDVDCISQVSKPAKKKPKWSNLPGPRKAEEKKNADKEC